MSIRLKLHRLIKVRALWPKWVKKAGHYIDREHVGPSKMKIDDVVEGPPQLTDDEVNDLLMEHGFEPVNPDETPEDFPT